MHSLEEIFANTRVDPATGCRVWLKGHDSHGYGEVWWQGKHHPVHRLVWELTHECDAGAFNVLHTCDNKPCCEPTHLYLGTQQDNSQDWMSRGQKNMRHKLTEAQVVEIRKLLAAGGVQRRIATMYGVSPQNISWIAQGKTWGRRGRYDHLECCGDHSSVSI